MVINNMAALVSGRQESPHATQTDFRSSHNNHLSLETQDLEHIEDHYLYDGSDSPPLQMDGLESLEAAQLLNGSGKFSRKSNLDSMNLLDLRAPHIPSTADIALSAMQYLPYPLLVLNGMKTLVMANESMFRLLGIEDSNQDESSDDGISTMDRLQGQTLSELGIDLLEDGRPVWVVWEAFLDSLADEGAPVATETADGDTTPTAGKADPLNRPSLPRNSSKNKATIHDAVVEVILSPANMSVACFAKGVKSYGYV